MNESHEQEPMNAETNVVPEKATTTRTGEIKYATVTARRIEMRRTAVF